MSDFLLAVAAQIDNDPRDAGRETASMLRAKLWLAEMQEEATALGREIDSANLSLFEHLMDCRDCNLREHMDPEFCEVADGMQDGEA